MTNPLSNLINMPHSSVVDSSSSYQVMQKFIADGEGDIFFGTVPLVISEDTFSLRQIVDKIKEPLKEARAVMPWHNGTVIIHGSHGEHKVLIFINANTSRRKTKNQSVHDLSVDILSHPDVVEIMKDFVKETFKNEKIAEIKWWTQGPHGDNTREMYLPPSRTIIRPEFYPDITDPAKYIADYMAAQESVLLLAGPPGTGKTTLLRHMISDYKLSAHVMYDEKMMEKDAPFQSFLFDEDADIMIIEDADTILSDREKDGNHMMSRFLNVSDGLIKLPNKKLVFTTNLTDFGRVDHALLRPGRCFGVLQTRLLTLSEAQAAAKVAALPIPMEKREYTIAQLFNQGSGAEIRKMGFVR